MTAFYNVALDLPHAGTVATRIVRFIETRSGSEDEGYEENGRIAGCLDNPGENIFLPVWFFHGVLERMGTKPSSETIC